VRVRKAQHYRSKRAAESSFNGASPVRVRKAEADDDEDDDE